MENPREGPVSGAQVCVCMHVWHMCDWVGAHVRVCVCSIWPPLRGGKCMQWSLSLPKTLVAMDRKLPAPGAGVEGLPRRL